MYEVTRSLAEQHKFQIGDELQKLFLLQDRPFSKEKSAALIEELEKSGLPAGALISGIRSLMHEDLKVVKLANILEASRDKLTAEEVKKTECDACDGRGMVMMKDDKFYEFAFACSCGNALRVEHLKLAHWNGENFQLHHGNTFKLRFPVHA